MSDESKSLDILGFKPVADSINKVATASVDGVSAFLSRICLPAAEEYGLLLQDVVRAWRASNISEIARKAKEKLEEHSPDDSNNAHAHPRVVFSILEHGSWNDDDYVQNFWAGLLASSCTDEGDDDSNLLFINLLADLTKLQARILDYVCRIATKLASPTSFMRAV